jgi:hypothetical protein
VEVSGCHRVIFEKFLYTIKKASTADFQLRSLAVSGESEMSNFGRKYVGNVFSV